MPLDYFLNNKLVFYSAPYNLTDETMDNWEFWKWQMNIEKINKKNIEKSDGNNVISEEYMKNILNINK